MGKKQAKLAYKKRQKRKRKNKIANEAKQAAANEANLARYREWAEKQNMQLAHGDAWKNICHDKVVIP